MAVKQVFETYVYDPGLSSVGQMPFVLTQVSVRHGEACGGMPHRIFRKDEVLCRSELAREGHQHTAPVQAARVIVGVFREQARSYRVGRDQA